jgi:large subunit ribosomal protein LP0
MRTEGIEDA